MGWDVTKWRWFIKYCLFHSHSYRREIDVETVHQRASQTTPPYSMESSISIISNAYLLKGWLIKGYLPHPNFPDVGKMIFKVLWERLCHMVDRVVCAPFGTCIPKECHMVELNAIFCIRKPEVEQDGLFTMVALTNVSFTMVNGDVHNSPF